MKQQQDNKTEDMFDLVIWPCGSWLYRYQMQGLQHKGNDYKVLGFGTTEYQEKLKELGEI